MPARTGYRNMVHGLDTGTGYRDNSGRMRIDDIETELMDCMNIGKAERGRKR